MRPFILLISAILVVVTACNRKPGARHITYVPGDDPRMNAAIEKARATVPDFVAALRAPKPYQSGFSVKMKFGEGDDAEHMWQSSVRYDGKAFHGSVGNEPESLKNVRMGQRAMVDASQISDWMYIENGKLVGGYTIRILLEIMTPEERREFDRTAPFNVD